MVSHSPFPHDGHGGRCLVEPTSISLPQLVQRYVPEETSLPAGTGFAIFGFLLSFRFQDPSGLPDSERE
jgi:hypothetical protein